MTKRQRKIRRLAKKREKAALAYLVRAIDHIVLAPSAPGGGLAALLQRQGQ